MHLSILSRAWQSLTDFMGGNCSGSVHQQNGPQIFTFTEVCSATKKFRPDLLVDEQCFAKIYKGTLHLHNQLVAVKQFKPTEDKQRNHKGFLVEVLMLSKLRHENIINLLGYCQVENQRLLVLEKAALHSLKNYLFSRSSSAKSKSYFKPLDWTARIKIALGVAKGLEYLHNKVSPPVIHRDLQTSSIMLGEDLTPKISSFEIAKLGPMDDRKYIMTSVVGTATCYAPEYVKQGLVSVKLDVYNFGIVLLELITGRRVSELICINTGHHLASWVEAVAKDTKKSIDMADPELNGEFQIQEVSKMLQLAAMCLREESDHRPLTTEVVAVLSSLLDSSAVEIQIQPQVAKKPLK
ncbi:hypothetical protein KFK09_017824 [Dendrobium nobile]|uniref:Protein kinase domain-containing protein n=1 Tax=Dendrobium nobile TaxID=94219 RepID=A0A8T3AU52_DENNO|nr:hypothetical protein KFK09_017824 [Dendrobium nobile]